MSEKEIVNKMINTKDVLNNEALEGEKKEKRKYTKKAKKRGRPPIVKRGRPPKKGKKKAPYTRKIKTEEKSLADAVCDETNLEVKCEPRLENSEKNSVDSLSLAYVNVSKPTVCLVASLCYIMFFLGFICCKNERFVKYHANQSLILLLFTLVLIIIDVALYYIFMPVGLAFIILTVIVSVTLFIMGISNAVNGVSKPLPLIGKITLIEY